MYHQGAIQMQFHLVEVPFNAGPPGKIADTEIGVRQ